MERVVALLQTNLQTNHQDMSTPELLVPLGKQVSWKLKPVIPLEITQPEFS